MLARVTAHVCNFYLLQSLVDSKALFLPKISKQKEYFQYYNCSSY